MDLTVIDNRLITNMTNDSYIKEAEVAYDEALEIVKNNDGWKLEKEDKTNQVTVEMKKNAKGRKIYRCKVSCLLS